MDPWRIGLLIASAAFFVFLLLRLRPRLPARNVEDEGEPLPSGTEERLYNRIRKLPEAAQRRIVARVQAALHGGNEGDDEPVD